jgi:2-haloacid dehalogenase
MAAAVDPLPEALTFDCYGTLIDWETGILTALRPVLDHHRVTLDDEAVLALYGELEVEIESGPYRRYREVLRGVVAGLGERCGFAPAGSDLDCLVASIGDWPPFPEAVDALRKLSRGFRLAVISNVDDDLFAGTARQLPVAFDPVVTAEQVGSYKPSHRNFEVAVERLGIAREGLLHCAQSVYHDVVPAGELGIRCVWVNRRAGRAGPGATAPAEGRPDYEVLGLAALAELLGA